MSATYPSAPLVGDRSVEAIDGRAAALVARVQANPAFAELTHKRRGFAWALSIVMLAIYFGFIGLVAYVPSVIGRPVAGHITVGLVLGIAVILSAIVLTGVYVWRANGEFDRLQGRVVADAERAGR